MIPDVSKQAGQDKARQPAALPTETTPFHKMQHGARSFFRPSSSRSSSVAHRLDPMSDRLSVSREASRPSTAPSHHSPMLTDQIKRDSAVVPDLHATQDCAPTSELQSKPNASHDSTSAVHAEQSPMVEESDKSAVPTIVVHDAEQRFTSSEQQRSGSALERREQLPTSSHSRSRDSDQAQPTRETGSTVLLSSPTQNSFTSFELGDLASDKMEFSNRGSILIAGKKVSELINSHGVEVPPPSESNGNIPAAQSTNEEEAKSDEAGPVAASEEPAQASGLVSGPRKQSASSLPQDTSSINGRILSTEELSFSAKVRNMYAHGDERASQWGAGFNSLAISKSRSEESASGHRTISLVDDTRSLDSRNLTSAGSSLAPSARRLDSRSSNYTRHANELAGGIEDWDDIAGQDVDRYGFIKPHRVVSPTSIDTSPPRHDNSEGLHRVATSLRFQADLPRRERSRLRRKPSIARSSRSVPPQSDRAASLRKGPGSIHSTHSTTTPAAPKPSLFRTKDQRALDEAADMLTLPPGLADIAEQDDAGRTASQRKQKEWAREEKWQKMARPAKPSSSSTPTPKGGGMHFTFDTTSEKLISRTWKGIPDRWRATAWHSFLSTSATRRAALPPTHPFHKPHTPDSTLTTQFHLLQETPSPDDVQIDMDVPRTINLHIMFRRRYRGGQRLLFRVLHAVSLHFPHVGYVQGMASLAATLLCYFDEEIAFVMCVRLWELRGLEVLYGQGFEGLMAALTAFEDGWLGDEGSAAMPSSPPSAAGPAPPPFTSVKAKLDHLNVSSTAYGTRWYLTLFSLSVPFPAQLRIWDIFLLLGDADFESSPAPPPTSARSPSPSPAANSMSFNGADLSILHATAAALVDATREILLEADFETAMKVLTSFIPVKDEDLLMRVVRVEWKAHSRHGKGKLRR